MSQTKIQLQDLLLENGTTMLSNCISMQEMLICLAYSSIRFLDVVLARYTRRIFGTMKDFNHGHQNRISTYAEWKYRSSHYLTSSLHIV